MGESEDKPVKYYCWDCHLDGLGTIEIVGSVYEEDEMGIATVWVCSLHKLRRLEIKIDVLETGIRWTREKIKKVKEAI